MDKIKNPRSNFLFSSFVYFFALFFMLLAGVCENSAAAVGSRFNSRFPAASSTSTDGPLLTMDQFLHQVKTQSVSYQAAEEAAEGATLRSKEASLIYIPKVFAEVSTLNERLSSPFFPYKKYRNDIYSLGIRETTPFGMTAALSYAFTYTEYQGIRSPFFEGRPRFEFSQSLWRNFFGRETRAQEALTRASAEAAMYGERYRATLNRTEAEIAYIRYATLQNLIALNKRTLDRANELLQWSQRRARLNLGTDSDLIQSQANAEAASLNLQAATDSARSAARRFNQARGVDSDIVKESVKLPDLKILQAPVRDLIRDDVRAAQAQQSVIAAQARLGAERNRPTLEVFGNLALNAREGNEGDTLQNSLTTRIPTTLFGIRFQAPISFSTASDVIDGYKKEAIAAEKLSQQRVFDQDIEWTDLSLSLTETQSRMQISEKLLAIQKRKALNERNRLTRGLSTTYQTLLFEQDYTQSEANFIQIQSQVMEILSRMKNFASSTPNFTQGSTL